jgi:hypothetical protein
MKKRSYKLTVAMIAVCLKSTSLIAQSEDPDGFGANIGLSYDGYEVNKLPFSLRNVPAHPDDGGGFPGAIERKDYSALIGVELAVGYIKTGDLSSNWRYRGGLGLKWIMYPAGFSSDTQRRNYTNRPGSSQRGEGAALTYVDVGRYGPIPSFDPAGDFFLAWTPEVKLEFGKTSGVLQNIFYGVSASYSEYRATTGWDRHDSSEQRDSETLSRCIPTRLYVTYREPDSQFGITIGTQLNPRFDTALGKQSGIKQPFATAFISFGVRY